MISLLKKQNKKAYILKNKSLTKYKNKKKRVYYLKFPWMTD